MNGQHVARSAMAWQRGEVSVCACGMGHAAMKPLTKHLMLLFAGGRPETDDVVKSLALPVQHVAASIMA